MVVYLAFENRDLHPRGSNCRCNTTGKPDSEPCCRGCMGGFAKFLRLCDATADGRQGADTGGLNKKMGNHEREGVEFRSEVSEPTSSNATWSPWSYSKSSVNRTYGASALKLPSRERMRSSAVLK